MKTIGKTITNAQDVEMIPKSWTASSVGQLVIHKKGYAFKSQWFQQHGKRVVKVSDFTTDSIDTSNSLFLDETEAEKFKDFELREGDVVVATVGSWPTNPSSIVGKVIRVPKDAASSLLNQNAVMLRTRNSEELDQNFLYYRIKCYDFSRHVVSRAQGSANQASITLKDIFSFEFGLPPIEEQRRIANFLSRIDSRISLNSETSNILEEIGNEIFKHWFIDFEFPNEEGKPYKSSGGDMVYSGELGKEMPKGWQAETFSKVIEVNPKRQLLKGEKAKKVSMTDLSPWQAWIRNWSEGEYGSGSKFKNGDTLFARITPSLENGKTALVSILENNEVGFGSTEFIVLSKKVITSPLYIFYLCRSEEIRNSAISAMIGTSGRQRVPDDLFNYLYISLPPDNLINEFERDCSSLFERIFANAKENRILSQIRDSSLPKLMSGEIRVPFEAK